MTQRAKAVQIVGGDSAFLKTSTERVLQIQKMYERLSRAFESTESRQFSTAYQPVSVNNEDTLSPSERAKYNSLLDKLDKVKTLHVFATNDAKELHYFNVSIFPSLTHVVLEMVPPSTVLDLYDTLRRQLEVLEVVNSGITDMSQVLAKGANERFLQRRFMPMVLPGYHQPSQGKRSPNLLEPSASSSSASAPASPSSSFQPIAPLMNPIPRASGWDDDDAALAESLSWPRVLLLRLRNCGIARMDQSLHLFPNAATIDLSCNDITHITHLHDCGNLVELNMSHNRVRVLSNLDRVLGNILILNLSHNAIQSLDGVAKLYSLQRFDCSFNKIDDVSETSQLSGLPCLEALSLHGNPIADLSNYRMQVLLHTRPRIPDLDGVAVTARETALLASLSAQHSAPPTPPRESHALRQNSARSPPNSPPRAPPRMDSLEAATTIQSSVPPPPLSKEDFSSDLPRQVLILPPRRSNFCLVDGRVSRAAHADVDRRARIAALQRTVSGVESYGAENGNGVDKSVAVRRGGERRTIVICRDVEDDSKYARAQSAATSIVERAAEAAALSAATIKATAVSSFLLPAASSPTANSSASATDQDTCASTASQEVPTCPESPALSPSSAQISPDDVDSSIGSRTDLGSRLRSVDLPMDQRMTLFNNDLSDSDSDGYASNEEVVSVEPLTIAPHPTAQPNIASSPPAPAPIGNALATESFVDANPAPTLLATVSDAHLGGPSQYRGNPEYRSLSVRDNLELYLREQVFCTGQGGLYLDTSAVGTVPLLEKNSGERLLASFTEEVLEIPAPLTEGSRTPFSSSSAPARRSILSEGQMCILALTSSNLFIIRPTFRTPVPDGSHPGPSTSMNSHTIFNQAPLFELYRVHSLETLTQCVVYFGFQRCCLQFTAFADASMSDHSALHGGGILSVQTSEYMLLPRCKARCQPLITRIPQAANLCRNLSATPAGNAAAAPSNSSTISTLLDSCDNNSSHPSAAHLYHSFDDHGRLSERLSDASVAGLGLGGADNWGTSTMLPRSLYGCKVKITNKDSQLLDAVQGACEGLTFSHSSKGGLDSHVCLYQLLHQIWRKRPNAKEQRSLIITPSLALLVEESLDSIDISLTVHGAEPISLILKVRQETNPLQITFIFRATGLGVFKGRKKWRLQCGSAAMAMRVIDECKKLGISTSLKG